MLLGASEDMPMSSGREKGLEDHSAAIPQTGPPANIARAGDLLATCEFVEFALLFGSYARQTPLAWSDVDIAVHVARPLDLLEIGRLTAALERAVGRDVDLLILNTALERNPALAYRVVAEGIVLFCRDDKTLVDFKRQAILRYLDTAYLREMVARAFDERLRAGRFGTRDSSSSSPFRRPPQSPER